MWVRTGKSSHFGEGNISFFFQESNHGYSVIEPGAFTILSYLYLLSSVCSGLKLGKYVSFGIQHIDEEYSFKRKLLV
jgi:hypothetical protein